MIWTLYRKESLIKSGNDLGTEYILDLLDRFDLTKNEHSRIVEYCREKSVLYLCTPWDQKSVQVLEKLNVPGFKVASADLTNLPLIENLAGTGKPLLMSTEQSSVDEIRISSIS